MGEHIGLIERYVATNHRAINQQQGAEYMNLDNKNQIALALANQGYSPETISEILNHAEDNPRFDIDTFLEQQAHAERVNTALEDIAKTYKARVGGEAQLVGAAFQEFMTIQAKGIVSEQEADRQEALGDIILRSIGRIETERENAVKVGEIQLQEMNDEFMAATGEFNYETADLLFADQGAGIIRRIVDTAIPEFMLDRDSAFYEYAPKALATGMAALTALMFSPSGITHGITHMFTPEAHAASPSDFTTVPLTVKLEERHSEFNYKGKLTETVQKGDRFEEIEYKLQDIKNYNPLELVIQALGTELVVDSLLKPVSDGKFKSKLYVKPNLVKARGKTNKNDEQIYSYNALILKKGKDHYILLNDPSRNPGDKGYVVMLKFDDKLKVPDRNLYRVMQGNVALKVNPKGRNEREIISNEFDPIGLEEAIQKKYGIFQLPTPAPDCQDPTVFRAERDYCFTLAVGRKDRSLRDIYASTRHSGKAKPAPEKEPTKVTDKGSIDKDKAKTAASKPAPEMPEPAQPQPERQPEPRVRQEAPDIPVSARRGTRYSIFGSGETSVYEAPEKTSLPAPKLAPIPKTKKERKAAERSPAEKQHPATTTYQAQPGMSILEEVVAKHNVDGEGYIGIKVVGGKARGSTVWHIMKNLGANNLRKSINYAKDSQVDLLEEAITLAEQRNDADEANKYKKLKGRFNRSDTQAVWSKKRCDPYSASPQIITRFPSGACLARDKDGIYLDTKVTDVYYLKMSELARLGMSEKRLAQLQVDLKKGRYVKVGRVKLEDATPKQGKSPIVVRDNTGQVSKKELERQKAELKRTMQDVEREYANDLAQLAGKVRKNTGDIEKNREGIADLDSRVTRLEKYKPGEKGPSAGMHITDYAKLRKGYIRNQQALLTKPELAGKYMEAVDRALEGVDGRLVANHQYLLFLNIDNGANEILAVNPFSAHVIGSSVIDDDLAEFLDDVLEHPNRTYITDFMQFHSLDDIQLEGEYAKNTQAAKNYLYYGNEKVKGIIDMLKDPASRKQLSERTGTEVTEEDENNLAFGVARDRVIAYNTNNGVVYARVEIDDETAQHIRSKTPKNKKTIDAKYANPSDNEEVGEHVDGLENIADFNENRFPDVVAKKKRFTPTYWHAWFGKKKSEQHVAFYVPAYDKKGEMVYAVLGTDVGLDFENRAILDGNYFHALKVDPKTGEVLTNNAAANIFASWEPTSTAIMNGQDHIYAEEALTELTYAGIVAGLIVGIVKAATSGGSSSIKPSGGFSNGEPWDIAR